MPRVGQARKRDTNEAELVAALEAVGATVERLSGKGLPDLLVGFRGVNYALEVKGPAGSLEVAQTAFQARWRGHYAVVRTVGEALAAISAVSSRQFPPGTQPWKTPA